MADPRYLETLPIMPAETGKWVYGKSFLPMIDGRIPVGVPGGLATLGVDGRLTPEQSRDYTDSFAPTHLADGQIFTVPAQKQAFFVLDIIVDGDLVIDGELIQVSHDEAAVEGPAGPAGPAAVLKVTYGVISGVITPDGDTDLVRPAALTAALTIANPSTTPADGAGCVIDIIDDGTSRALTWGSMYADRMATLPAATTAGKRHRIGVEYNAADDKLYCMYAQVQP